MRHVLGAGPYEGSSESSLWPRPNPHATIPNTVPVSKYEIGRQLGQLIKPQLPRQLAKIIAGMALSPLPLASIDEVLQQLLK